MSLRVSFCSPPSGVHLHTWGGGDAGARDEERNPFLVARIPRVCMRVTGSRLMYPWEWPDHATPVPYRGTADGVHAVCPWGALRRKIRPQPPPNFWAPLVGVGGGGPLGGGGRPVGGPGYPNIHTYIHQNDPLVALIILNTHMGGF